MGTWCPVIEGLGEADSAGVIVQQPDKALKEMHGIVWPMGISLHRRGR